eukprot:7126329-Pyramimonas_sp.AAC.1
MTFQDGVMVPLPRDAPRAAQRRRELQDGYLRRYGIQGADWASIEPPSAHTVALALRKARKSAPGPEGLAAKAWLAMPLGVETLAEAMSWQLEGLPMRQEWNYSIA